MPDPEPQYCTRCHKSLGFFGDVLPFYAHNFTEFSEQHKFGLLIRFDVLFCKECYLSYEKWLGELHAK